jgi:hypothetical protein
MFGLASGLYHNYFIPPEVSILLIGLDDAGKTTLLERVKVTDFSSKQPSGKRIILRQCQTEVSNIMKEITQKEKLSPVQQRRSSPTKSKDPKKAVMKRRMFSCPAPKLYSQSNVDSDDENDELNSKNSTGNGQHVVYSTGTGASPRKNGIVELSTDHVTMSPPTSPETHSCAHDGSYVLQRSDELSKESHGVEDHEKEYDLKLGKKMFPLHLIRPTRKC